MFTRRAIALQLLTWNAEAGFLLLTRQQEAKKKAPEITFRFSEACETVSKETGINPVTDVTFCSKPLLETRLSHSLREHSEPEMAKSPCENANKELLAARGARQRPKLLRKRGPKSSPQGVYRHIYKPKPAEDVKTGFY